MSIYVLRLKNSWKTSYPSLSVISIIEIISRPYLILNIEPVFDFLPAASYTQVASR